MSCTDAHDKDVFLPACVATKASLELPRHAWTWVAAAKEGKNLGLGYSKTCLQGWESPTQNEGTKEPS